MYIKPQQKLYDLIVPVVETMGYELVGIEYFPHDGTSVLRIYIDTEQGIVVKDCQRVSEQVSTLLDVEDPIPGFYHLEISSPGLDRPLFTEAHFERFIGSDVRIQLETPMIDGRRKYRGKLLGISGGEVRILQDGEEVDLPFAQIQKARLVAEV
ncbi:MAG: ribosome maturation factor RimP [Gammaproteobacteria bacterium]|nr:ribosome maturation factor RimP [Gammaproteobacteria bacterium]